MPPSEHKRILVVRTDRIGDVVLATPLIRAIRKQLPDAYLAAMVRPYTKDILLLNPHLNEIIVDDPEGQHRGSEGFWNQTANLRLHKFDTALVLLPKSRLSGMLFLAGIRTRVSVETRLDHILTFTKTVTRNKYIPLRHEADYCLDLGRRIDIRDDGLAVEVFLSDEEKVKGLRVLESRGFRPGMRLIGLSPGSGRSAPNWKAERYAELAELLLRRDDIQILAMGNSSEAGLVSVITRAEPARVIGIARNALRADMAMMSHCSVLVSSSTGPMHIAAGLKVPTVSLFCPLPACSPTLWGPRGNESETILPDENFCQRRCPGDPHICRFEGGIHPRRVADSVLRMLRK